MWFWIIAGALLLFGILICWMKVTVMVCFVRRTEDDHFYVDVKTLFGLFKFRYDVPQIKLKGHKGIHFKNQIKNETKQGEIAAKSDAKVQKADVQNFIQKLMSVREYTAGLYDWVKQLLCKVHVCELKWRTDVGIGNAPETAITSGVVWAVKANALSFMLRFIQLDAKPDVQVNPLYNQVQFSTSFSCISQIRMGQIINASIHLLIRAMQVKGGIRAWRNILFKA